MEPCSRPASRSAGIATGRCIAFRMAWTFSRFLAADVAFGMRKWRLLSSAISWVASSGAPSNCFSTSSRYDLPDVRSGWSRKWLRSLPKVAAVAADHTGASGTNADVPQRNPWWLRTPIASYRIRFAGFAMSEDAGVRWGGGARTFGPEVRAASLGQDAAIQQPHALGPLTAVADAP